MKRSFDTAVIGAGILGCATSYYLATLGQTVVVLERGAPNREGSGTTAGNLHIQSIHPSRPGQTVPANPRRLLPLQVAASRLWQDIEGELERSIEVTRFGGFMVAETAEQIAHLEAKQLVERDLGLHTELLTGDEARYRLPLLSETITAAVWCDQDGYANPLLAAPAFLDAAIRHGAVVKPFAPVSAVQRRGSAWLVTAGGEEYSAGAVVNVAGPWISAVAQASGLALPMSPVAIQMNVTVREQPRLRYLIQHIGEGLSLKQVTAGNFLIGGGWPARSLNLTGRSPVDLDNVVSNLTVAARVFPLVKDMRLLRTWAGPLAATPDEMPVIGPLPGATDYYIAGGTYAFTLAPLWGRVLASMVTGRKPEVDVADLLPDRFINSSRATSPEV